MAQFEFFFSLYGLILGLAIAVVIGGLSDILRERDKIPIGWLTPLLALFLLVDLTSMWTNAWSGLRTIQVALGPFLLGTVIAGVYYFAASMVFPKNARDWPSLDHYYLKHYRFVLAGVMGANLGLAMLDAVASHDWHRLLLPFTQSEISLAYFVVLTLMLIFARRWLQIAGLALLLLGSFYAVLEFWKPL